MVEHNLARRGNHESDLVLRVGKGHGEIAVVMHTPETHAVVSAVDTADDDAGRDWRGVGVAIAEEPGEEGAEVFGVEVFGAEDDCLAGAWGHLGGHLGLIVTK